MMKHFKYILLVLITIFAFTSVNAESSFTPSYEVPSDITENQFDINLGFYAEENMIVIQKIKYDSRYIDYDSVIAGDHFTVTVGEPVVDGYYKTITVLADSDYAFESYNYAQLVFNVKPKMRNGSETDIIISDIQATGTDKKIHKAEDRNLYLHRIDEGIIEYRNQELNSKTKFEIFIRKNLLLVIAAIISFILIIIVLQAVNRKKLLATGKSSTISKEELMQTPAVQNPAPVVQQPQVQQVITPDNIPSAVPQPVVEQTPVEPVVQPEVTNPIQPIEPTQPSGDQLFNPLEYKPEITESQSVITAVVQQPVVPVEQKPIQTDENIAFGSAPPKESNLAEAQPEMEIPKVKEEPEIPQIKQVEAQNQFDSSMSSIFSSAETNVETSQSETQQTTDNTQSLDAFNSKPTDNNILSIVAVLIMSISLFTYTVHADGVFDNSQFDIEGLRKCLAANSCRMSYDYNSDNKVDILDLLSTKDLSRTVLEEDTGGAGHGFEKIEYKPTTRITKKRR